MRRPDRAMRRSAALRALRSRYHAPSGTRQSALRPPSARSSSRRTQIAPSSSPDRRLREGLGPRGCLDDLKRAASAVDPRTSGAPGSTRANTNTSAAARADDGRTSGQDSSRQARNLPTPASRAASSHDGSSCSTAADVTTITSATPQGRVDQIHTIQSGRPRHDSRLTPSVPPSTPEKGHGQGRGAPEAVKSQSEKRRRYHSQSRDHKLRAESLAPRTAGERQPTPRRLPTPRESSETNVAKITLFRAQVHAKSSKSHSTSGNRCGETRVSPAGPRSTQDRKRQRNDWQRAARPRTNSRQESQPA